MCFMLLGKGLAIFLYPVLPLDEEKRWKCFLAHLLSHGQCIASNGRSSTVNYPCTQLWAGVISLVLVLVSHGHSYRITSTAKWHSLQMKYSKLRRWAQWLLNHAQWHAVIILDRRKTLWLLRSVFIMAVSTLHRVLFMTSVLVINPILCLHLISKTW